MATLLCVDDETHIREDIVELMESAGHTVLQACDGQQGLEMIVKNEPDIVLSDITMPNKDGHQLLSEVRANYPKFDDMPFIFLSALSDHKDILDGMDLGADDYLTKPIDFPMLERKVEARLREIERIRKRSEQDLVKLFRALSGEDGVAPVTTPATESIPVTVEPTASDASQKKTTSTSLKELDYNPESLRASPEEQPKQPVYGTVFQFPNLSNLADELGSEHQGVCARIRERATRILKRMLFENGVVSETEQGDIFVSYNKADKDQAQEKSKQLSQALQDGLLNEQNDALSKTCSITGEKMAQALIVSDSLFEISISQEDLSDIAQFEKAVKNVVEQARENERAPTLLVSSIKNDQGSLEPLKLIARNGDTLPIRFFNYDETSKLKMRASFAFFGSRNLIKAGYLIDILTLELLASEAKQLPAKDIIIVDVHFGTLISENFAPLYISKFLQYAKNSRHTTMINVRSIPPDITSARIEEILRPLGKAASRRAVQIDPGSIKAYSKSRLPVSCIVCSCPELKQSKTALTLFPKVKPDLTKTGTLLVLRGLNSADEISQYNNFGFDGYALNELRSD